MQLQLLVVIICCSTAVTAQHYSHTDILHAVDVTFGRLDANRDGILEEWELLKVYGDMDKDGDNRVSEAEYGAGPGHKFWAIVFQQLDYNHDGYLGIGAELGQYTMMDTSDDNQVSRREYDVYYTKVVEDAIKNYGFLLATFPTRAPTSAPTGST